MNPAYGWEVEYELKKTDTPKDILIVGGGVAGLQCAYAAAKRGHRVVLCEKSDSLGGQLKYASEYPALYTRELFNLPRWLIDEIGRLPVEIRLNTEADEAMIEQAHPDVIIVATGAVQKAPCFEVAEGAPAVYLWDYLAGAPVGKKVVVIGDEGVEAAASLATDGCEVTWVTEADEIPWPPYIFPGGARREPLSRILDRKKVDVKTGAKVLSVGKDAVKIAAAGKEESVPCDTVIYAMGRDRINDLFLKYKAARREVHVIGDAKEVRNMTPASHEGYWIGRTI
jgi:NADPH-dependent 2,4-dienoyl-CoA reductase/sulfur reductase-like enzyme